jgi:hypothetical protein
MMRKVIDRVAQHDVPRLGHHDLTARLQPPVCRQQEFVGRRSQRLACFRDVLVEHGRERAGRLLTLPAAWRRQVEFVLSDDERDPRRHRGDEARKPSERHRLRVRLPVVATGWNTLHGAAGPRRFAIEFVEKELSQFHRGLPV